METKPYISIDPKNQKSIIIHNIDDYTKLGFDYSGISYQVFSTEDPRTVSLKFTPIESKGDEEKFLTLSYDGKVVDGTPLYIQKKMPSYQVNTETGVITFSEVMNPEKLSASVVGSFPYELFEDSTDSKTFHMKYDKENAHGDVTLFYDGKKLRGEAIHIEGKTLYQKPGTLLVASNGNNQNTSSALITSSPSPKKVAFNLSHKDEEQSTDESESDNEDEETMMQYTQDDVGKVWSKNYGHLVRVHNPSEMEVKSTETDDNNSAPAVRGKLVRTFSPSSKSNSIKIAELSSQNKFGKLVQSHIPTGSNIPNAPITPKMKDPEMGELVYTHVPAENNNNNKKEQSKPKTKNVINVMY